MQTHAQMFLPVHQHLPDLQYWGQLEKKHCVDWAGLKMSTKANSKYISPLCWLYLTFNSFSHPPRASSKACASQNGCQGLWGLLRKTSLSCRTGEDMSSEACKKKKLLTRFNFSTLTVYSPSRDTVSVLLVSLANATCRLLWSIFMVV